MGLRLHYVESIAPFKDEIINRLVSKHLQFNLNDSFRILTPDPTAALDMEEALITHSSAGEILIGRSLLTLEKFSQEILQNHPQLRPVAERAAKGKALRLALKQLGRYQRIDYSSEQKYLWGLERLNHLEKIFQYSKPLPPNATALREKWREIIQKRWGLWDPEAAREEARKIVGQGKAAGLGSVKDVFFFGFHALDGELLQWVLSLLQGFPETALYLFLPPPDIGIDPQGLLAPLYEILEKKAVSLDRYQRLEFPEITACSYPTPLHEANDLAAKCRPEDGLAFHGNGMSSVYLKSLMQISPHPLLHPSLAPEVLLQEIMIEGGSDEEVYFKQIYAELEPQFQKTRLMLARGEHLQALYHLERSFDALRKKLQWEFYQEELLPRQEWVQSIREELREIRWPPGRGMETQRMLRGYQRPGLKTATQIHLLELNEGIFPRTWDWTPLLMAEGDPLEAHEGYLSVKSALHLAARHAQISCVDQDMEGRTQKPSPLLEKITGQSIMPKISTSHLSLCPTGHHPFFNKTVQSERQTNWNDFSTFSLQDLIAAKINRRPLAASYVDDYAKCPWKFFARWHLSLEPPTDLPLEMEPKLRGRLIHAYLEKIYQILIVRCFQKGQIPQPPDVEQALDEALAEGLAVWKEWPEVKKMPPRLVREEINVIKGRTAQFVRCEIEAMARAKIPLFPNKLEWRFGLAPLPRIEFPTDAGKRVPLAGAIDRVDYNAQSGEYLVLDYKSSSSEEQARALREGLSFQLVFYLYAVQHGLFPKGKALGALYGDLKKNRKNQGIAEKSALQSFGLVKGNNKSFLNGGEFLETRRLLEKSLGATLHKIMDGVYPLNPVACEGKRCPYHEICRYDHQPL